METNVGIAWAIKPTIRQVLGLLRVPRFNVNKAFRIKKLYYFKNYGGVSIKNKFFKAIKDVIIIILIIFLVATVLNYMDWNISLNKYWSKLGNLGLINIYENNNLNGLVTLGFILAILSFVYDMFFKKETKEVKRK